VGGAARVARGSSVGDDGFELERWMTRLRVTVFPKPGVLDPQGKAIERALGGLGFEGVGEVRVGKVMLVETAETDPARARAAGEEMARRLLANTVIESFTVELA
jgi:phosphoribosylformylglycinamidine synthase